MKIIKVSKLLPESEALHFVNHFKWKEPSSETLATGIVQIFRSYDQIWTFQHVGILYFLLDQANNCYRLRLYTFDDNNDALDLWHQDVYKDFIYVCANNFFHMFEGDDGVFGINFSDILEAHEFKRYLNKYVLKGISPMMEIHKNIITSVKKINFSWFAGLAGNVRDSKPKRKQHVNVKGSLNIGGPSDFQHVTHVGFDGIFGETENQQIVTEIRRIVKLVSDEMNSPEMHDYVNMIAYELRNIEAFEPPTHKSEVNLRAKSLDGLLQHATLCRPPAISWSYDEDLQHISFMAPATTSKTEMLAALANTNNNRQIVANTIATAIAKRSQAQNYSDTEDESTTDDEWI